MHGYHVAHVIFFYSELQSSWNFRWSRTSSLLTLQGPPALVFPGDELHSSAAPAGWVSCLAQSLHCRARHRLSILGWAGSFLTPGVHYELEQHGPPGHL